MRKSILLFTLLTLTSCGKASSDDDGPAPKAPEAAPEPTDGTDMIDNCHAWEDAVPGAKGARYECKVATGGHSTYMQHICLIDAAHPLLRLGGSGGEASTIYVYAEMIGDQLKGVVNSGSLADIDAAKRKESIVTVGEDLAEIKTYASSVDYYSILSCTYFAE